MPEFTIAAGEHTVWDHQADGVLCTDANLPTFTLTAQLRDGGQKRRPGFRRGYEWRPGTFNRVEIENPNSVDLVVTLEAFAGDLIDRRLITAPNSIAPVSIDELRGKAYRLEGRQAGVASQYTHVQVWNPANSGRLMVVQMLEVSVGTAASVNVYEHNTKIAGAAFGVAKPVHLGDADGNMESYRTTDASILPGDPPLMTVRLQASETQQLRFLQPLLVPEGLGVAVVVADPNITMNLSSAILEIA